MNTFDLSRNFWNFAFDNPEKITPNHSAIYFFAIEHCNRLGGKEKFGFPTMMVCDAIGIKKASTYIKYFNDLIEWGFIGLVEKSSNQYSSNIICFTNALPKKGKALDKAIMNHRDKQSEKQSTCRQTTKQLNNLTTKQLERKEVIPPKLEDVISYFIEKNKPLEAQKFFDFYESNGWKVGKNKMKSWKAASSGWISRMNNFNKNQKTDGQRQITELAKTIDESEFRS